MIDLSILVPSVHTRFNGHARYIQTSLYQQYDQMVPEDQARVEIIFLADNKKRTIGSKRNDMLAMAQGEYVAFVDDDDRIEPTYLKALLAATESLADVITFIVSVSINGQRPKPCFYDINYAADFNRPESYHRLPNHIMCVRRKWATMTGFRDIQKGEDADYAKRLQQMIVTHPSGGRDPIQFNLGTTLYHYDFNSQTTETQR